MKRIVTYFTLIALILTASLSHAGVTGVVNINAATPAEIEMLPGIGEAKAQAIVTQRLKKPFAKKEELLLVKGIGDKLLAKIAPYVALSGTSTIHEEKTTGN